MDPFANAYLSVTLPEGGTRYSHRYGTPSFRKRRRLLLWPSESVLYLMQVWQNILSSDIGIFFCSTGELKNSTVILVARFGVLLNFLTLSRKSDGVIIGFVEQL